MKGAGLCNDSSRRLVLTKGEGHRLKVGRDGQDVIVREFCDTSSSLFASKSLVKSIGRDGHLVLQEMPTVQVVPLRHVKENGRFILQKNLQSGCWHTCDTLPSAYQSNHKSTNSFNRNFEVKNTKGKPPLSDKRRDSPRNTSSEAKLGKETKSLKFGHHSRTITPYRSHHRSRSLPPSSTIPLETSFDMPSNKVALDIKSFLADISATVKQARTSKKV